MIKRDNKKIPKPAINPAGSLIEDTIEHHQISQKKAAESLAVSRQLLNNIIKRNQSVSVEFAIRFELCFSIPATQLLQLQATYDYQLAYHGKKEELKKQVKAIA